MTASMVGTHNLSNSALRDACSHAVLEVLETMFFEIPIDEVVSTSSHEPDALVACARFEGSLDGRLCVAISQSCASPLAAAFLGIEEEEAGEDERRAMLIELTNIVCGATLSRLAPSGRLRITQPELMAAPDPCDSPWLRFPLSCGTFEVALWTGRAA